MPFTQPWFEVDFGSAHAGLATVGYRLYQATGADSVARTTTGVVDVSGDGQYGVPSVNVPDNAVGIQWDTGGGSPVYAVEDIEPYRDRMNLDALISSRAVAGDEMDLVTDAVDATAIATGAIDADAIATDAITAGKIAANAIGSSELAPNAITDAQIATDAITADKIAANAIGEDELANGAITAAKIAANAIGSSELASNAITDAQIATDAITADKIAANAIGEDELANNAITAAKIASNAIGSSELATGAITAAQIATDAIDADALAADAVAEIQSGLAIEANVEGHVTASLNTYDPPTRAEATADKNEILTTGGAGPWTSASANDWTAGEREQIRDALGVDGSKTTAIAGQLQRALGLTQENYKLINPSYNANNDLTQATVKIYPTATDLTNDTNVIATYQIDATYDANYNLNTYEFKKL